jgi:glycosyltransferase involved in cell wall biosynthesis
MRILHLCKMDAGGGAADGFMRIHEALLSQGVDSTAYVMKKKRSTADVIDASKLLGPAGTAAWLGRRFASKLRRVGRKVEGVFDFDVEGVFPTEPIIQHARGISSNWDVVLVHWLGGYMSPQSVVRIAHALNAKIGLWQVDMAHMTGGCHYSLACGRYREGCGRCPALGSVDAVDVTLRQAATRAGAWRKSGAIVLAQSHWSARKAAESYVLRGLRQAVLPIPLDLERLPAASDPLPFRHRLGLPTDGRRVALVRPVDPGIAYKGFGVFQEALRRLDQAGVRLHVAGAGPAGLFPPGMKHVSFTDLGHLSGDSAMSAAYQAADFFVCPSIDDAGPMMIPEAMASGRPVLSTSVGIAPDLIIEGKNGSLCGPPGDPEALYLGLRHYAELAPDVLRSQGLAAAETRGTLSRTRFVERLTEVFSS